jgi:site-specific DNA recombinase
MVANGLMEQDDPQLRDLLTGLKLQRDRAAQDISLLESQAQTGQRTITPKRIERFAFAVRKALLDGDPAFRKAWLRLFVDTVVVSDTEIRIGGPTVNLAKAASSEGLPLTGNMVPTFVLDWRPVRDSNSCRRRERAVSWASRRTGPRALTRAGGG